ncbi:MAG: hypothetical protein ACO1SV_27580 [Fimbriimonas sp.]
MTVPPQLPTGLTLRTIDTRPIELLYCFLTLGWGASLIVPGDAFAKSAAFGPLASVGPDYFWGLIALAVGTTRAYGLFRSSLMARLLAAMGGGMIWTFTWVTMLLSGAGTTGVAVYGVLATVNLVIFVKLCRLHGGRDGQ